MSNAQYHPLPAENVATGVVGIVLFTIVLGGSAHTLSTGVKSSVSKAFFCCLFVTSILEYPRYFALAVDGEYDSVGAYCCHILAGSFFFGAFTLLCYQWVDLLAVSDYLKIFYGRDGLIAANVIFGCIDVASLCLCATSASLHAYFQSSSFRALNAVEAFKNLVYSMVLCFYGVKLVVRMLNYSGSESRAMQSEERQDAPSGVYYSSGSGSLVVNGRLAGSVDRRHLFLSVAVRLTTVLTISTACFLLRVVMLISKIVALHEHAAITSRSFSLFGFLWFLTADFVPRVLPSLAFIFLMRTKKPADDRSAGDGSTDSNATNHNSRSKALDAGATVQSILHENHMERDSAADHDDRYSDYGGH